MAIIPLLFHLVGAVRAYSSGNIILNVIDNSSASTTKTVQLGIYTNEQTLGTLQIKPTLFQSLFLYNEHFSDHGANVIFFLILGILMLIILKFKPQILLNITESKFYQYVGGAGILYFALLFAVGIPVEHYFLQLTGGIFKLDHSQNGYSIFNLLSLFVLFNVILQYHAYAVELKKENDLTI